VDALVSHILNVQTKLGALIKRSYPLLAGNAQSYAIGWQPPLDSGCRTASLFG
jgi:hypothetical protein